MKGIAFKTEDKWFVKYSKYPTSNKIFDTNTVEFDKSDYSTLENLESKSVNFKLIDFNQKAKLI